MSALSDALNKANVNGWSSREIARRAGDRVHHATISKFLNGKHSTNPGDDVLSAFAEVFPTLSLVELRRLAGRPAGEDEPYRPPAEAALLSARQRKAVDELIRSMVAVEPMGPEEYDEWMRLGVPRGIARDDWRRQRARVLAEVDAEEEGLVDDIVELHRGRLQEAARRGTPRLRSVKQQQDEAGEAPDPEGPEGGA